MTKVASTILAALMVAVTGTATAEPHVETRAPFAPITAATAPPAFTSSSTGTMIIPGRIDTR